MPKVPQVLRVSFVHVPTILLVQFPYYPSPLYETISCSSNPSEQDSLVQKPLTYIKCDHNAKHLSMLPIDDYLSLLSILWFSGLSFLGSEGMATKCNVIIPIPSRNGS